MMQFQRSKYPDLPGAYLMKDANGEIIYIGKATSLRDRLSNYFTGEKDLKTSLLVPLINEIEFVITRNAEEALILESNLIKENQPRFNLLLKDARHFSYLAITNEQFPRLLLARKNSKGKFRINAAKFYGPYVEGSKRAISAAYLRRLFKIRICKKLPKRECLQFHMGNCDAPCIGKISKEDYSDNVKALERILMGKAEGKTIIKNLEKRMQEASEKEDYEAAKTLRDQIDSLNIFFGKQRVERRIAQDEDFLYFQRIGNTLHARLLKSRSGVIRIVEQHDLAIKAQDEPEITFCVQYYANVEMPDRIYSNIAENDMEMLNSALKTDAFRKPDRDKERVLMMASESLRQAELEPSVLRLQEVLGLEKPPIVIEAFDISTLFGENSVGSMVRFVNGKPDKSGYRKFKIKGVEGQDDFAMMEEVVGRRYKRLLDQVANMPDLILIDGGPGQLHSAKDALEVLGLQLNLASIAKQEEEIYTLEKTEAICLPRSDSGLKLLQFCRDEAHRFAISFHRKTREKNYKE